MSRFPETSAAWGRLKASWEALAAARAESRKVTRGLWAIRLVHAALRLDARVLDPVIIRAIGVIVERLKTERPDEYGHIVIKLSHREIAAQPDHHGGG